MYVHYLQEPLAMFNSGSELIKLIPLYLKNNLSRSPAKVSSADVIVRVHKEVITVSVCKSYIYIILEKQTKKNAIV